ncbi:MAG: DegT/DnrJ/EryC1/StrS family aminotransferase [bacterium]|nr:DegT/DnrJ/EryC1/StrS family aminotransferase [bacterium]
MTVPFLDTTRDIERYRDEYLLAARRVLDSGAFSLGPAVQGFEEAFSLYLGVHYAIGVSGGTMALYAALLSLGIGRGDEVIVPSNTFIATAEAVVMTGAKPVFCDVPENSFLVDVEHMESVRSAKTKAVIVVHLYGQAVSMNSVLAWAKEWHLRVVEDCAQAHGAVMGGKRVGSFGDVGCFSFYPTKNLGSLGEGGAAVTDDAEIMTHIKAVRCHGIIKVKYQHDVMGTNLKMAGLQGAFLSLKLGRLDEANARRREIACRYREAFAGLPILLPEDTGDSHVYYQFVLKTDQRDRLLQFLKDRKIGAGIYYPVPCHLQPSMRAYSKGMGQCPNAERHAEEVLSLPMFPELTNAEVEEVTNVVRSFFV